MTNGIDTLDHLHLGSGDRFHSLFPNVQNFRIPSFKDNFVVVVDIGVVVVVDFDYF
jgi:hypothetical protein